MRVNVSAFFFWEVMSLSLHCLASSTRALELCVAVLVSSGHAVIDEPLRWTNKRSSAARNELGSTPSIKVVPSIDFISRMPCGLRDDAKTHCSELATGQPFLWTYQRVGERAVDFLVQCEELCLWTTYSILVFSTKNLRNLRILRFKRTRPRFDMLAFRYPSYHRQHSRDHVLDATAEFMMNFRTRQICLLHSDADHASPATLFISFNNVT